MDIIFTIFGYISIGVVVFLLGGFTFMVGLMNMLKRENLDLGTYILKLEIKK